MRLSKTFMGAMIAMLIVALAIMISGKNSSNGTPTDPIQPHKPTPTAPTTPTDTATTAAATSSYPLVDFLYNQQGALPFTAQSVSISENPTVYPGTSIVS